MTTALDKIIDNMLTVLSAAAPTVNFFADRDPMSDDGALRDDEYPAAIARVIALDVAIATDFSQAIHTGILQFDCLSGGTAALTIDRINRNTIATIIEALFASDDLGGRVQTLEPQMVDATEQSAPDVGWAVLQYQLQFYTPRGDFRTLVGPSGQTF